MPDAGSTAFGTNSPLVTKPFSVSLAIDTDNKSTFVSAITDKKSRQAAARAKHQCQQTSQDMPIVLTKDMQKTAGDEITCNLLHMLPGTPAMGDTEIEGRGVPMDPLRVRIGEMHFPADAGGRMTRECPLDKLRSNALNSMAKWFACVNDQIIQIHLAGARGSENTKKWTVPLDTCETRDQFKKIMINDVLPPTTNRYFVAGERTSVEDFGTSDLCTSAALKLGDLDFISATRPERAFQLLPIEVPIDSDAGIYPVRFLLVTKRQWRYIRAAANSETWQMFIGAAQNHVLKTCSHPLLDGETGLWNGLLVKQMPRAIRFQEGDTVKTTESRTGDEQHHTVPAGVKDVDRAILLGSQALAWARGNAGGSPNGCWMRWTEVDRDHGNAVEIGAAQVDGKKKIQSRDPDGNLIDFGVAVIDSYAPDPELSEGKELLAALRS